MKLADAEKRWEKAKQIVRKEYDYSQNDPEFWALVTTITKRMIGFNESEKITFKRFISEVYLRDMREIPHCVKIDVNVIDDEIIFPDVDVPMWTNWGNGRHLEIELSAETKEKVIDAAKKLVRELLDKKQINRNYHLFYQLASRHKDPISGHDVDLSAGRWKRIED